MGETSEGDALGRKRRRVVKTVKVMTDPNPQFVSLVQHGANQTPVTVFRSADAAGQEDQANQEENEMGSNTKKQEAQLSVSRSNGSLHKLGFPSEVFPSEEAVRSYLDAQGYEGGTVTSVGDGFEVVARAADDFAEGSVKAIAGDDGVVRHIGVVTKSQSAAAEGDHSEPVAVKEADGDGQEGVTEPAVAARSVFTSDNPLLPASTVEVVKRYDSWEASWSNGQTIQEVMAAGADGMPVGIWELNDAFYTALRNLILAGNKEGIAALCTEFGSVVLRMLELLPFAAMPQELAVKMLNKPNDEAALVTRSAEPVVVQQGLSDEQLKEVAAKVAGLLSSDKSPILQLVAKSVGDASSATAGINAALDTLREQVAQSTEQLTQLASAQTQMAQKVDQIYQAPPQSRSVSDSWLGQMDGQHSTPARRDSGDVPVDPLFRNSLGMGS